ncbi:3-phosphoglycerate dehydrogenase [Pseudoroseomonas deserti]|uniref:3-phosphoglycerate dehydrogenase n=1 Tax=Teichococcus deserti TaxID=1817963 RepID=A0A1V2H430_9PROT|nr:NAD(P)-dependent oxidoreductase [Pseudoroseomonas deserti]ONG55779.1 3-phosphoglycerate dehydrogenase [Pseudoroseomonas deserti]
MRAVFVDANATLGAVAQRLHRAEDMPLQVNIQPDITSDQLPALLGDAEIAIIDHTHLPTDIAKACKGLKHVVFLGTGARSYMNPEELAAIGIEVHIIKGYGDTAVAECAFALMWTAAKGFARMDRGMRAGNWLRSDGVQLTGKTVGLIGYGGIASEMARLCRGAGMKVQAWNRSPKTAEGVTFTDLDTVLATSDVLSVHLLLNDETRGFLGADKLAKVKDGAILINTARGAVVDEAAMIAALASGKLAHAGLDVFDVEPLPANHPLTQVENVTLSAHSAFRTPEASDNLFEAALQHCRRIEGK